MFTLLIVEVEPAVMELMVELLSADHRDILTAASYEEALEVASSVRIDIALVERTLRSASGLELTKRLTSGDENTHVIITSAYPSLDSVIEAVDAGARDFLAKPFEDIEDVAIRVRNAEERVELRRRQARLVQELRVSEERYRRLFDASPDAVLVIDEKAGVVQDANPAALALYGYTEAEMMGLAAERLRGGDEHIDSMTGGHPRLARHRVDVSAAGDGIDVEVSASRVEAENATVRVEVVRDIRGRLQAEKKRRELEDHLRQSQKMEALGTLAGGVAHDFNNLLSVILHFAGFVEEALGEHAPQLAEAREDVEQILQAAGSAVHVTRQLLAFSRRDVTAPEQVSLSDAVTRMEKILRPTIGENITLSIELSKSAPVVLMDPGQLEQIVMNLAVNARDAMPSGGTLTIATECRGEEAVVLVRDTGEGISPAARERMFEPFFTTKERGRGTGLGLATVRGIVEQVGGRIEVSSALGEGSEFRVVVPRTMDAVAAVSDRSGAFEIRARPGECVLVVEDDDAVRRATCRILERAGFQLLEARNGDEALRRHADHGPVDIVVSDVMMPHMSGNILVEALRERQPELPCVLVTGYASVLETTRASHVLLPKPFRDQRLLEIVRRTLDAAAPPPSHSLAS